MTPERIDELAQGLIIAGGALRLTDDLSARKAILERLEAVRNALGEIIAAEHAVRNIMNAPPPSS